MTDQITIGNMTFEALIDTGSSVTLIREDVSKESSTIKALKGHCRVIWIKEVRGQTKGSFQREIELDGEIFRNLAVVPTPYLEFQAGDRIGHLEQAFVKLR
ncbi:hypothetical protein AVEN_142912-1 [Araneus ventricosus]|uniref:Peptidase A2 domain-containing protein n=1 Tax=Araneus ventricosus TaxID=182803 RepID=A0A4Y2FN64_ARAVE|nr:hypothetical protein AVEN_142912-1 [Araneus ventricosus]